MTAFLERENAPNLAYQKTEAKTDNDLPTVMFLGGFRSDMQGTKAIYFEEQCKKRGQAYVRFDYRGHGQSEGKFEKACISEWKQDSLDILNNCTSGPVLLVGSSMGGWISLLLALQNHSRIHSLVGLAAAPDFTIWMEEKMNDEQRKNLKNKGFFELPNDYDEPYIITQKLLENGRENSLLKGVMDIKIPVRLIQGRLDEDVDWRVAEQIKNNISGHDVEVLLMDEADHRLSTPDQLQAIDQVICNLSGL